MPEPEPVPDGVFPATQSVRFGGKDYPYWVPERIIIESQNGGQTSVTASLRRCRVREDGTTDRLPDLPGRPDIRAVTIVTVQNVNAPAETAEEPSLGEWWDAEAYGASQQAAQALGLGIYLTGSKQGVL